MKSKGSSSKFNEEATASVAAVDRSLKESQSGSLNYPFKEPTRLWASSIESMESKGASASKMFTQNEKAIDESKSDPTKSQLEESTMPAQLVSNETIQDVPVLGEGSAESSDKDSSELILNELKKLREIQQLLLSKHQDQQTLIVQALLGEGRDESIKDVLHVLKDMNQQQHDHHVQELTLLKMMHELEKQSVVANLDNHMQLKTITEKQEKQLRRFAQRLDNQSIVTDDDWSSNGGHLCCGLFD